MVEDLFRGSIPYMRFPAQYDWVAMKTCRPEKLKIAQIDGNVTNIC
jgi:hypothetical protein